MTGSSPSWSDIAGWYDRLVESGSGPHETALACTLDLVGDPAGCDVLDLACGQGLAARELARAGAKSVLGVDSSHEMIDLAQAYEDAEPLGLRYIVADAQSLSSLDAACFDGVNCQLGLMDIPDLDATLRAVRRVLRPSGWFVFVIGHPCFLAPDALTVTTDDGVPGRLISGYFDERFWRSSNPEGVRRAGNYHRTLSTYFNALIDAGFSIDRVAEPRPSPRLSDQQPEYSSVPIFWGTRARSGGDSSLYARSRSATGGCANWSANASSPPR